MKPPSYLVLPLVLLIATATARPQDAAELEIDHSMSAEFQTPHIQWGPPAGREGLRMMLFCNGRGTVPREGVELKQRFGFDVDAVFWARIVDSTRQGWHGGELGVKRMLRLVEKPHDCYVFFEVTPEKLGSEMQYKLLKRVTEGSGLVLVGGSDKRILKPKNRLGKLSVFLARTGAKAAFRVGKGRGVVLPKRPNIPYDLGWQSDYEAWQERLGRAILWAAGWQPDVRLTEAAVDRPTIDRAKLPGERITVSWRSPTGRRLTISLTLRRRDGVSLSLPGEKTEAKEGSLRRRLPRLRAGRYHLDVFVRSKRGIENWATVPFAVTSQQTIEIVKHEPAWAEIGGQISGWVVPRGPEKPGQRVLARLRDRRERILAKREVARGSVMGFMFPIEAWMPMLVRVEVIVVDADGSEVAAAYAWFRVVKRHRGRFNFLIWDTPRGATAPYAEESLARLGTTLQLGGGSPARLLAAYDIAWVPYTTRILESHDARGVMKPSCWNDEAKVLPRIAALAEKYRPARRHGVFAYSLGDENHVRGSCLSPHCRTAYRKYLAGVYGTIDALNASWGSAYRGFDEVRLLDPNDNLAAEAKRRRNYPRWYDREAFRSWNYVQYCKKYAAAYRKIDPNALTGFEGAGRFGRGDDIDLFVRELGFWSPYPGTADEVLRSIAPKGFPRANWMGYRKDADSLIGKYWRMVTRGCPSVWWWRWDCIGRFHGFLAPHLGPWPATRELVDETQIVRDGLGDLLMRCEMLDGGVAMLFSHPSTYANRIESGTTYGGYENSHRAWHRAIRELGLNFRYVTDRQLRRGEFDPKRYKVLILAQAEAIAPKEAEIIEAFVRGGGHVIADVRPGIYDGRCKPLAAGCLDGLFGIRRTARAAARKGKATLGLGDLRLGLDKALCDGGVQLAGGKATGRCGDVPLLIANRAGSGRAWLLNFSMTSYPKLEHAAAPEAARTILSRLFREAGVRPFARVLAGNRPVRNIEIVHWRTGELNILALFRHKGPDEDVRLFFSGGWCVRDLRHRRSFGPQQVYPTRIHGSRPTFLVVSAEPLAKLKAALFRQTVAPGERPRLRLEVPRAAGLHAVRIRATTPDGRHADWLDRVAIVGAAPEEVTLPIAFNDPPGAWEIKAVDLFTEKPLAVTLNVGKPGR
jgi:hypothetical protein